MTAKIACRYFDHDLGAEVFEFALENARALWYMTKERVVHMFWCPRRSRDDLFDSLEYPLYRFPRLSRTDRRPESNDASCLIYFDGAEENPVGLQFRLDDLSTRPKPGQTLAEHVKEVFGSLTDSRLIEIAITPNLLSRLGAVPILLPPTVRSFF